MCCGAEFVSYLGKTEEQYSREDSRNRVKGFSKQKKYLEAKTHKQTGSN